ncbi:zinc ribbon domain-containing protein [Mogibacterium timidum]|uniref:Zinc ribbon domain-containing protein n=1 Tax=Mogibacterium timidum TaxID=35519 RepID=A0A7Y8VR41_9FIRM|nr:zinc ribbon domain-containing protein [Mogibacterium timidum]NWO22810.1 zinc ribbon domain-containing protein [Mogibacterium timidum]
MFCSNCGNEVAEGARFCSVCGARINPDAEQSVHEHTAFSSSNTEGNMMDKSESSTKFDFGFGAVDSEVTAPKKKTGSVSSVSFDWSSVIEESHKKPVRNVRSPWETTGIDDGDTETATHSFNAFNTGWEAPKTAEPEVKTETVDPLEEMIKRDSAAAPAAGRGRTMNFIEVMKQEKKEREKAAKAAEDASTADDFDYSEPILPDADREHTHGYTELKDDIVAELEQNEKAAESGEKEASDRLDAASADFDEYINARRKSHEEVFRAEPPHNFVDDMVHVSAAETRDEFKLPEDEFESELSKFMHGSDDKDEEPADKTDDDLFNFDVDIKDTDEDEETLSQYLDYVTPSRVSRAEERAAEDVELDDEDDDDEPETFSYDEVTDDSKEQETEYDLAPKTELKDVEVDDFTFGDEDIDVPYDEPVNYSELYMGDASGDEVKSAETKVEAPVVSAVEAETDVKAPITQASEAAVEVKAGAANGAVVATADAESAVAKEIESEIANLQRRLAELLGKDPSETVELPSRDIVSVEELTNEPVAAPTAAPAAETKSAAALGKDASTAKGGLTSAETELAGLGFDTIDGEPDEEANILFSADDVADANNYAVADDTDTPTQEEVMSIDDLQKDLFGEDVDDKSMEATRKIDKFYTLYRKNEEFQQLLDEEYKKLQDGSADYTLMEDVLADYQDENETEETPAVEGHHETVEAAVKAESAKLEAAKNEEGSELSMSANVTEPVTPATTLVSSPVQKAVIAASAADPTVVDDDDDEEVGKGGVLTVIAVIVAILLVLLLVVILILNFAPDSGIAQQISGIIGKFTNFASLGDKSELLL